MSVEESDRFSHIGCEVVFVAETIWEQAVDYTVLTIGIYRDKVNGNYILKETNESTQTKTIFNDKMSALHFNDGDQLIINSDHHRPLSYFQEKLSKDGCEVVTKVDCDKPERVKINN